MLETMTSSKSCFATLTYSDDRVPMDIDTGHLILRPRDVQLAFKRLRHGGPFRFFLVGEYGDRTWRPHYHACFFGLNEADEERIYNAWGEGFVSVRPMDITRAKYIAHYTTKKMTHEHDERLEGRPPEFARMSRDPGIGIPAIPSLAAMYQTRSGGIALEKQGDIVTAVRFGRAVYPLDKFAAGKLRESLGLESTRKERGQEPVDPATLEEIEQRRMKFAKVSRRQRHGSL